MLSDSEYPLISVIVPVYKVEAYLRRCLDSICRQSYTNLEIICVDDGSPDGSIDILREYEARDARVKVIRQANAGLSAARNTALNVAQGEWVTGVDADDWLEPGIYEKAVACLSDEVDMLCFETHVEWDCEASAEKKRIKESYFELKASGCCLHDRTKPIFLNVCFWNKLWRRSLIEQRELRFVEHCLYEDEGFFVMFMPGCRAYYLLQEVGYHYLQRENSIMGETEQRAELRENMFRQAEAIEKYFSRIHGWREGKFYFGGFLKMAFMNVLSDCQHKVQYYRAQCARMFFEHRVPMKDKRFCAMVLSPLQPDVFRLLPGRKKPGKLFLIFHYSAYLIYRMYRTFILLFSAHSVKSHERKGGAHE